MLFLRVKKLLNLDTISFKTISANKKTVNKDWILVDASGQNLGRLASKIAILLRGKNKPNFSPHVDCGDNVVVINSAKINLSGKKWSQKNYIRYSGYPGGQRSLSATELFNKNPNNITGMRIAFQACPSSGPDENCPENFNNPLRIDLDHIVLTENKALLD